jgi:hypothetical protein
VGAGGAGFGRDDDAGEGVREIFLTRSSVEVVERTRDGPLRFAVSPRRWGVERTFGWLNCERRLVKKYDRTPESTRAWIFVAALRMMVRSVSRAKDTAASGGDAPPTPPTPSNA